VQTKLYAGFVSAISSIEQKVAGRGKREFLQLAFGNEVCDGTAREIEFVPTPRQELARLFLVREHFANGKLVDPFQSSWDDGG
jgi:hypothetical protein